MITWVIIFTGRLATITNQYETPYCVAHAFATCGSFYWYDSKPETYIKQLWLTNNWYNVDNLPQALYKMRVSKRKRYTREKTIEQLNKWPILLNIADKEVEIFSWQTIKRHLVCAMWYDNNYIYIANSFGTGRGYKGYGRIASWDINLVSIQTLWSKILTPSLITLTERKENSLGSGQAVKSPTINKRNTRKRFSKPLD